LRPSPLSRNTVGAVTAAAVEVLTAVAAEVVSTAVVAEELRAVLAVAIMPAAVAAGRIAVLEAATIAVVVLAGTLVVDMRVARTAAVIGIAARTAGAIEPGRQWRRGQRIPMPVAGTRLAARPEPTGVHHQIARWQPIVL
jgi:hypothetical protein